MDLTGKWRYIENYGYGVAEGELYLKQKGQTVAGRDELIDFYNKHKDDIFISYNGRQYDTGIFKRRTGRT